MNQEHREFIAHPIGRVEKATIRMYRHCEEALDRIEEFSHIIVVYWLDRSKPPHSRIYPKGNPRLPRLGYFATRTPHRANPIGVAVVRLVKRDGVILKIEGLDAWSDTPVLDIKPYTARDSVKNFRLPRWLKSLEDLEADPLRKCGRRPPRKEDSP